MLLQLVLVAAATGVVHGITDNGELPGTCLVCSLSVGVQGRADGTYSVEARSRPSLQNFRKYCCLVLCMPIISLAHPLVSSVCGAQMIGK